MDHSFDFSNDYNDSFAIVSASNIAASGSAGGHTSSNNDDACNQSIIVDNVSKIKNDDILFYIMSFKSRDLSYPFIWLNKRGGFCMHNLEWLN